MNILITMDNRYIEPARVMLSSLQRKEKNTHFDVYVLHSSLTDKSIDALKRVLDPARSILHSIRIDDDLLAYAPTTDRYPVEMYFRIFAARYLPKDLDRILYLDPDLVINRRIDDLYNMPIDGYLMAAATHVREMMRKINVLRLDMHEHGTYINSGVLLLNLDALRKEQDYEKVFEYIKKYKNMLMLPDQDILSGLYSDRVLPIDAYRYNMTERLFRYCRSEDDSKNVNWIRANSAIIHYCGRNKPWKSNYIGKLDVFYRFALKHMNEYS